jgi:hypothetical protein
LQQRQWRQHRLAAAAATVVAEVAAASCSTAGSTAAAVGWGAGVLVGISMPAQDAALQLVYLWVAAACCDGCDAVCLAWPLACQHKCSCVLEGFGFAWAADRREGGGGQHHGDGGGWMGG